MSKKYLFLAAVLALAPSALAASAAQAQTATNLVCSGCVGAKDLGNKAVTRKKLKENAVKAKHLHKSAKPAGVDFIDANDSIDLTGTFEIVRSLTLTVPSPGFVIVFTDYLPVFDTPGLPGVDCRLQQDGIQLGPIASSKIDPSVEYTPVSITRVAPVDGAGDVEIELRCAEFSGNVRVDRATLTGLFVPNRY